MNRSTRDEAAHICQLAASNRIGIDEIVGHIGASRQSREMAMRAFMDAGMWAAAGGHSHAEAEAMIRTGWEPPTVV